MTKLLIKRMTAVAGQPEPGHLQQGQPQSDHPVYRWRVVSRSTGWLSASRAGSPEELSSQYPEAQLILLGSGFDAGIRRFSFQRNERKHLTRLLPNELEPELATDLSTVHTALGEADLAAEQISLAYADKRWLKSEIDSLESLGFEVVSCVPEPLLLKGDEQNWKILCDAGQLHLCWGRGRAVSIDPDMLLYFVNEMAAQIRSQALLQPAHIQLLATDQIQVEKLVTILNVSQIQQTGVSIQANCIDEAWDALDPVARGLPDLRSGEFAPPLRWQKLWKPVRLPVKAFAAAWVVFVVAALVEIQVNNHRHQQLQSQIEQVYREVVPAGVLVDAEQQLRTQLAQFGRTGNVSRLMPTLAVVSPSLQPDGDLRLHRLNYSAAQGELQLGISASSNADILALSERINQAGLVARPQNLSRIGDRQQASLLIQESRR